MSEPTRDGEPWEWRPPRPMHAASCGCALDAAAGVHVCQPAPPVAVSGARYRAKQIKRRGRGPSEREAARRYLAVQLQQLTDEQRQVVRLQLDGLTYAEIGQRLGVPVVTVRERLRRARARLAGLGGEP